LIIGEQEMEAGKVAVRRQGEGDIGTFTIAEFAEIINKEIKEKLIEFN
jgi:threonyl-tRNA synthetase